MHNIIKIPLSDKWLKASVLGSLWASMEILLGSFLHNLRIPFTGTILSMVAVIIIISFIKNWNQSGIIIRAAIICSIMKSISPSAVILGPMIGIIIEGFLMESSLFLFGRNPFGFFIAGILAVVSPLIQNIIMLVLLYGNNIIEIFYKFAITVLKNYGFHNTNPFSILIWFLGLNIILSFFAVVSGIYIGKKIKEISIDDNELSFLFNENNNSLNFKSEKKYSIFWLISHSLLIISMLIILNYLEFIYSILIILFYSGFSFYQYRFIFKRFRKSRIWLEFGIIIILSSVLLGGISSFSNIYIGILIGFNMLLRAIIIIIGFSIIGYELRNPVIINRFINLLGRQFYISLDLAFITLPIMTDFLSRQDKPLKHPVLSLIRLFKLADYIQVNLRNSIKNREPKVIIISGKVNSGKTTLLKSIIEELQKRNRNFIGIITENQYYNNEKIGFDIVNLKTGEKKILCRKSNLDSIIKAGNYYFSEEGLRFGNDILKQLNIEKGDFLVIDEIGNLELNGEGWSESIDIILQNCDIPIIFVARENLLRKICRRWNIKPIAVYYTHNYNVELIISDLSSV